MLRYITIVLCLVTHGGFVCAENTDIYAAQRTQFSKAYGLLKRGQSTRAKEEIAGLETYPLFVYFRYEQLRNHLTKVNSKELDAFFAKYKDSYIAERLRRSYLDTLARQKKWSRFVDVYRKQSSIELQCHALTARLETGDELQVIEEAARLWTHGKSRPAACDRGFEFLESTPRFNDPLVWQRFRLAMHGNNVSLAGYLQKKFTTASAKLWSQRWIDAHREMRETVNAAYVVEDNPLARSVYFHALKRLAKADLSEALAAWDRYRGSAQLTPAEVSRGYSLLATAAAKKDHERTLSLLNLIDHRHADASMENLRLNVALEKRAWPLLAKWFDNEPNAFDNRLRWRYWYARALEQTDKLDAANLVYQELAKERDYYGFLGADRIDHPYRFNYVPIDPSPSDAAAIFDQTGLQRSREFFLLGMERESIREWTFELEQLNPKELEIAAALASSWGWHNRAIAALGKARSYDDIEIRFPVLHRDTVEKQSRKRQLETAVTYSIIRTESAFNANARSGAGAMGLMQLMPATGRETARRSGVNLKNTRQLLDPTINIALGTSYLAGLLKRYNGNFPMAAAGYNAGPHRVKRWRPKQGCTPSDIWIELIPFRETRRYVRRTLFYYAVYQHRLGVEQRALSEMLQGIPAAGETSSC